MMTSFAQFLLFPSLALSHGGLPSASQILSRCQQAYDSVSTFEEDVVAQSGKFPGTAHISYQRPGKLRVTGKAIFGANYQVLINGGSTQVFNNNSWQAAKNPEMGIATVTGVSGAACAQVPALLFHTSWYALIPDSQAHYKVSAQNLKGIQTFRLDTKGEMPRTLWIDQRSYFLVKTSAEVFRTTLSVEFAPPKVNQSIPANRFRK